MTSQHLIRDQQVGHNDHREGDREPIHARQVRQAALLIGVPEADQGFGEQQRQDRLLPDLDSAHQDVRGAELEQHHDHEVVERHPGHEKAESDEWAAPRHPAEPEHDPDQENRQGVAGDAQHRLMLPTLSGRPGLPPHEHALHRLRRTTKQPLEEDEHLSLVVHRADDDRLHVPPH